MVNVKSISNEKFKEIGFKNKQEALSYNVSSYKGETEAQYLNSLKKMKLKVDKIREAQTAAYKLKQEEKRKKDLEKKLKKDLEKLKKKLEKNKDKYLESTQVLFDKYVEKMKDEFDSRKAVQVDISDLVDKFIYNNVITKYFPTSWKDMQGLDIPLSLFNSFPEYYERLFSALLSISRRVKKKQYMIIQFDDGRYYTVTPDFLAGLLQKIKETKFGTEIELEGQFFSEGGSGDEICSTLILKPQSLTMYLVNRKKKSKGAGFFPYYNTTDLDLSELQIFQESKFYKYEEGKKIKLNKKEMSKLNDNCFTYALKQCGLSDAKLNSIRHLCVGRFISNKTIKTLCNDMAFMIELFKEDGRKLKFGTTGPLYKLAIIENHYFINKEFNITPYAAKHVAKLKGVTNWQHVDRESKGYYSYNKKKNISAYELVKYLLLDKERTMKEISAGDIIDFSLCCKMPKNITSLEYLKTVNTRRAEARENPTELTKIHGLKQPRIDNRGCQECQRIYCYKLKTEVFYPCEECRFWDKCERCAKCKLCKKKTSLRSKRCTDCARCVECNKAKAKIEHDKNEIPHDQVYADFECSTDGYHRAYLVRKLYLDSKGEAQQEAYYGSDCAKKFLKNLKTHTRIICHNMDYDYRFFIRHMYVVTKEIEKDGSLMAAEGFVYNYNGDKIHVIFKCSYKLINMKLEKFPTTFYPEDVKNGKYKVKKEVMPYDIYTWQNVEKKLIPLDEIKKSVNLMDKKKYKIFEENIHKWKCIDENNNVDIIKYSDIYCEYDCKILYDGYTKFREMMLLATGIDCNYVISLASLANQYLRNQGVYEDCYELSGIPRAFIMNTCIGGRTMTRDNQMHHVRKRGANFDCTSLYPSAMRLIGFLMGRPKIIPSSVLSSKNIMKYLNKYDGYFIEVKITKINKKRHFPLLSYKNQEGVRIYTNDLREKIVDSKTKEETYIDKSVIFLDKYGLEDAIKFQEIEFEVIRGYYFDEGRNYKIQEVIQSLFDNRKKYKSLKNPMQLVYKEIMNSAYGKTIMKPAYTEIKYVLAKNMDEFLQNKYYFIQKCEKLEGTNMFRVCVSSEINNHFTLPHIGCEILSMSKRIMNEVMCLAEDLGIEIYYQDTDSMHIEDDQIDKLSKAFKKEYGRELIGNELGQFHTDFESKYIDENGVQHDATNIVSIESFFCAKKVYLDILECEKKDGTKYLSYHSRLKSVNTEAIKHYVDKRQQTDPDYNVRSLYEELYNGGCVVFDLLCKNVDGTPTEVKFTKLFDKNILSRSDFTRTITFNQETKAALKKNKQ